jgi:hypothetical protein
VTRTLVKRIQKLESMLNVRTQSAMKLRYGYVKRLPKNLEGDRHVETVKSESTAFPNVELCTFEERLGPAPDMDELTFDVYLSLEEDDPSAI